MGLEKKQEKAFLRTCARLGVPSHLACSFLIIQQFWPRVKSAILPAATLNLNGRQKKSTFLSLFILLFILFADEEADLNAGLNSI